MATSTFVLKDARSKTPTLIYFVVRSNGKRLKYSTQEYVLPTRWGAEDYKAGYCSNRKLKPNSTEKITNTQLNRYTELFELVENTAKLSRKPVLLEDVRAQLDKEFKRKEPKKGALSFNSLTAFAENHIKVCDKQLETRKGYRTSLNKLKAYQKAKNVKLTFENIDLDFYFEFVEWLNSKGYATNTVGGHIKNIKVFMDVSFEAGLHKNESFRSKKFKVLEETTDSIYLTENELTNLYNLDLSQNQRLDRVRDLFLVGCRSGLRFSDLSRLTADKMVENCTLIQMRTQKTGEVVYIPLHQQVKEILNKYSFNLPTKISNQKFNAYLKELAELAEINEDVTIYRTYGGINKATTYKKYQLVSAHSARRTFATLAYKAKMPVISIMKITGHKSTISFMKYVKLSNKEHAQLMAGHEFFTPLKKVD